MPVVKRRNSEGKIVWCVRRVVSGKRVFRTFGTGSDGKTAAEKFDSRMANEESSKPHEGRHVKGAGSTRAIPIPSCVRDIFEDHALREHKVPFGQAHGKRIGRTSLSNAWIKTMKSLGMPYRLHDLRHTYACRLAAAGVNPPAAQRILGHTDIKITMRYYRLTESDVFTQVTGVPGIVSGTTTYQFPVEISFLLLQPKW